MNAALVLAAGFSRRFPGHKLLCEIQGKPLLRHTVERVLACREVDCCHVVIRRPHIAVAQALEGLPVTTVRLDGPGVHSESLKAGLKSLPIGVRRVLVALGDQPIKTGILNAVMCEALKSERDVIVPTYQGQRGNPVIFRSEFFPRLFRLDGDVGARACLKSVPEVVVEFELGVRMPPDLDVEDDLRSVALYLRSP